MSFLLKQNNVNDLTLELNNASMSLNNVADENHHNCGLDKNNQHEKRIKLILNAIMNGAEDNQLTENNDIHENIDSDCFEEQKNVQPDEFFILHESEVFCFACNCELCIKNRIPIIELVYEDFEFNTLWERLQLLIRKFYDIIPDDNSIMDKKYKSLMSKDITKWLSDGRVCNKNIQISLGSNLPLSNEMTFILVFSILYTRDPHQLFELLCIQLRSVVVAYSEGLKNLIKQTNGIPEYNQSDLLNFILDGYDKICKSAKALSPLLFELQRGHLQQFSLTWHLLNKRMYYRWVYLEVQKLMPECLLKLKQLVYSDKYKSMVFRFIKFDDEMTLTKQMWKDVWSLIHDYNLSKNELDRRSRISNVHSLIKKIKSSSLKNLLIESNDEIINIPQLITMEKSDIIVWKNIFYFITKKWIESANDRLSIDINKDVNHFVDCKCRTCSIAGAPCLGKMKKSLSHLYSAKTSFYEKVDQEYVNYITKNMNMNFDFQPLSKLKEMSVETNFKKGSSKNDFYHLSWAVFKHIPDRIPYELNVLDANNFCIFKKEPCSSVQCKVAVHIVAAIYPLNFAKLLIGFYHPVDHDKRKDIITVNNIDLTSFLGKLHDNIRKTILGKDNNIEVACLNDLDILSAIYAYKNDIYLFKEVASLFAESCLTDFKFTSDENIYPCFLSLFKLIDKDVELDLDRLDAIYSSRFPIPPHRNSSKKSFGNDLNAFDELKSQMKKLEISKPNVEDQKKENRIKVVENVIEILIKEDRLEREKLVNNSDTEETTSGNFVEARKFVEHTKINRELEEELMSLKKEHRVLKDMVRDLEQIKEYEEKLIQIKSSKSPAPSPTNSLNNHDCKMHDCNHKDESPGGSSKDSNSSKICHRSEGQCVCYYCTIFGYTECSHGRSTGTRDRLRKRLNQIQSMKDINKPINMKTIKNTSDLLKSMSAAKSSNIRIPKDVEIKKTANPLLGEKIDQIKDLKAKKIKSRFVVPPEQKEKINLPKPKLETPPPPPLPPPVLKPPPQLIQPNIPSKFVKPIVKNEVVTSSSHIENSIGTSSVNDLVQFIEGATGSKSKDQSKKAAKKAKQKQKKEELRKIQELDELRYEFHDICRKDIDLKTEIKSLRSAKKKDRKKINEFEVQIKKVENEKSAKEYAIKDIINMLKKSIPDFKFPYQLKDIPVKPKPNITPPTLVNVPKEYVINTNFVPGMNPVQQFMPLIQASMLTSSSYDVSTDPAKRMVTIRRVNLPHADPQVTVTAKGSSPDKDMLLYTFVNGQLVPANANNIEPSCQNSQLNKTIKVEPANTSKKSKNDSIPKESKLNNKKKNCDKNNIEIFLKTKNNNDPENQPKIQSKINNLQSTSLIKEPKKEKVQKIFVDNIKTILTPKENNVKVEKSKEKDKKIKSNIVANVNNSEIELKEEKLISNKKQKKKAKKVNSNDNIITEKLVKPTIDITSTTTSVVKRKPKVKYEYCESVTQMNKFKLLEDEFSDTEDVEEQIEETPIVEKDPNRNNHKSKKKISKINEPTTSNSLNSNKKSCVKAKKNSCAKTEFVETKKELARLESIIEPPPKVVEPLAQLSKKQKKKLKKIEVLNAQNPSNDKNENMLKSLSNSMQRLQLNPDTTIELVKENESFRNNLVHQQSNISIMDQLKLGVNVEGLKLPPGITLTRVDPILAEAVKAKKESISKITQPMKTVIDQQIPPQIIMGTPLNNPLNNHGSILPTMGIGHDPNGVIMIDTMNIKKSTNANGIERTNNNTSNNTQKKNKRNRKKNKNLENNENKTNVSVQSSKMVTLRNPMFHAVSSAIRQNQVPVGPNPVLNTPVGVDQPAAIIKNENGMFTIRNPALHQAIQSGVVNNFRQQNPNVYNHPEQQENFSYFSDGVAPNAPSSNKCYSAIGSEMKSVQQQKQMQQKTVGHQWNDPSRSSLADLTASMQNGDAYTNLHFTETRQSPYENQCVYGLQSNFIIPSASSSTSGSTNSNNSNPTHHNSQSSYFENITNGGCYNNYTHPADCNSLFSSNRCSETNSSSSSPPSTSQHQLFDSCGGAGCGNAQTKYNDVSFIQNLQPGHRLNSEVTIHNISESKFLRNQQQDINIPNGVEITKIHASSSNINLAVGSNRNSKSLQNSQTFLKLNENTTTPLNEFGDHIFAPNQTVNLSELESEERDIESFKRFNYYFEPPKNKPKININVKDIVVNKKNIIYSPGSNCDEINKQHNFIDHHPGGSHLRNGLNAVNFNNIIGCELKQNLND